MDMNKTLFVGLYDFTFGYQAYVLENKQFKEVELDVVDADLIQNLTNDYNAYEDKLRCYSALSQKIKQYDFIIVCEDSCYSFVDLVKYKEMLENERIYEN